MARIGAPRVFFNVIGSFEAGRMIDDAAAQLTVLNSLALDGFAGLEDAGMAIAEQMTEVVEATIPLTQEIERATIEFEKFLSVGGTVADNIGNQVIQVGQQFGFTAAASLDAGARMAQLSGIIGDQTIPAATEMALAFGLIGDMAPEDAMLKLINLQQQTNFLFDKTTKATYDTLNAEQQRLLVQREMATVLNQLNSVEDNSAATMSKITRVMNEFAAQADMTGESIAMMAAQSAVLIEAGEEQGKAGRALRTIYARLGADINGAAKAIEAYGVATTTADGQNRSLSAILQDLMPQYRQMTQEQKQLLAQQVAGNLHYVRFLKLAEGFDRALELNQHAMAETGQVFDSELEKVGFLADLTESNTVALDAQRAALERSQAALGDLFIPGVVSATEFQAEFNQAIVDTASFLPGVAEGLSFVVAMQQKMSGTLAPFLTMQLNLKGTLVALQTFIAVYRTMTGTVLKSDNMASASTSQRQAELNVLNTIEDRRLNKLRKQLDLLQKLDADTTRLTISEKTYGFVGAAVRERNAAFTELGIARNKELGLSVKGASLKTGELEEATEQVRLAEERFEQAVISLGAAIESQTNSLNENIAARERLLIEEKQRSAMTDEQIADEHRRSRATKKNTQNLHQGALAAAGLNASLMGATAGIMIADVAVMAFSDKLDEMGGEGFAASISLGLMTTQMIVMTADTIITTAAIIKLSQEQAKNTATTITQTTAMTGLAGAMTAAGTAAATAGKFIARFGIPILGTVLLIGGLVAALGRMRKKKMEAAEAAEALGDAMEQTNESAINLGATVEMEGLEKATNAVRDFTGTREEMFFGFKADAVSGNLVRQVQQTGVETFINNTEVIMTNNFNGMTTQEVAQVILDEIQRSGKAEGITFA